MPQFKITLKPKKKPDEIPEPLSFQPQIQQVSVNQFQHYVEKVESETAEMYSDALLPPEIEKQLPVSAANYKLFEYNLPASGHLACLLQICLASIGTDERRQCNLIVGAHPSEGKTEIFEKFSRYPHINWLDVTTFADYLINKCGYYFDETCVPGKEIPKGVKITNVGGQKKIVKTDAQDYINGRFDFYHAGENIQNISGFDKYLAFLMGLIEKGHWQGGHRMVGDFIVGDPAAPIKHGVALACTLGDLKNNWFKTGGFLSRCIVVIYQKNQHEHDFIVEGREPPNVKLNYYDFANEVGSLLTNSFAPKTTVAITFNPEVKGQVVGEIMRLIMVGRDDAVPERAMNDRIALLKGCALLNGRNQVNIYDVIFCDALLSMCKTAKYIATSKPSGKPIEEIHYFGDRLSFQMKLRFLLYGNDYNKAKTEVMRTFTTWDKQSSIYPPEYVDKRMKILLNMNIGK